MTATMMRPRRPIAARRVGYGIAVLVNAALLFLTNVSPGWEVLPFLTPDFAAVLGLVNLSIAAGVVVNAGYLLADPPWFVALGGVVTNGVGLAAMIRLWQVFPFDLLGGWSMVARVLLVLGILGSGIGLVANFVTLLRVTVRSN